MPALGMYDYLLTFCFDGQFGDFNFSALYQITHLGDDDDEPEFTSTMAEQLEEGTTFFFHPRDLKNLVLVDEMESLSPMMHCQVRLISSYIIQHLVLLIFSVGQLVSLIFTYINKILGVEKDHRILML